MHQAVAPVKAGLGGAFHGKLGRGEGRYPRDRFATIEGHLASLTAIQRPRRASVHCCEYFVCHLLPRSTHHEDMGLLRGEGQGRFEGLHGRILQAGRAIPASDSPKAFSCLLFSGHTAELGPQLGHVRHCCKVLQGPQRQAQTRPAQQSFKIYGPHFA